MCCGVPCSRRSRQLSVIEPDVVQKSSSINTSERFELGPLVSLSISIPMDAKPLLRV